jgi:hypothetical protein
LRRVASHRAALFVLLLLGVALAHAFTSRGDAVPHARLIAAFVPMTLLAAAGFDVLRRNVAANLSPLLGAAVVAALVGAGGVYLFFRVNPRILPASALATSFEALDTSVPNADAVFIDYHDVTWLYTRPMAGLLPARPFGVIGYGEIADFDAARITAATVLFWSPGLETDFGIARSICARWPQSGLYTLIDRAGLFRAFAACPEGARWQPELPPERWRTSSCETWDAGGKLP